MRRDTRFAECSDTASTVRSSPPASRANTFPDMQRLLDSDAFEDFVPLLPAPLLMLPKVSASRGHRIRQRQARQRAVRLEANIIIKHLNALDCGICKERTNTRCAAAKHKVYTDRTALERFVHRIKRMAAIAVLERRDLALGQSSGAHATAALVKADIADRYNFQVRQHNQIPLMADCIDEPSADWPSVDMLCALPPHEREYYAHEHNVVETEGKDHEEFKALEKQYGFVGGTYDEYIKYFQRTDCDQGLWHFVDGSEVRATAGFSVVPKKAEGRQRKLLMQVPANYYWQRLQSSPQTLKEQESWQRPTLGDTASWEQMSARPSPRSAGAQVSAPATRSFDWTVAWVPRGTVAKHCDPQYRSTACRRRSFKALGPSWLPADGRDATISLSARVVPTYEWHRLSQLLVMHRDTEFWRSRTTWQ